MSEFTLSALTESLYSAEGLKHAILQSLLNFSSAQKNDPLDEGQSKQGWWADEFVGSCGCRDWTLAREKQTPSTLNRAKRYTEKSLMWLIDDNIVKTIAVTTHFDQGRLVRVIDITLANNNQQQLIL